jgi:hypothetical protein
MSWTGRARLSKGQKDWRQTTRAIGQEKKIWRIESLGKEQREQEVSGLEEWIDWEIRNLVGIIFQTIFHKNNFNRWLRFNFHKAFQWDWEKGDGETGMEEVIRWWTDFVMKVPKAEGVQRTESWMGVGTIFIISMMVEGWKIKDKSVEFQV